MRFSKYFLAGAAASLAAFAAIAQDDSPVEGMKASQEESRLAQEARRQAGIEEAQPATVEAQPEPAPQPAEPEPAAPAPEPDAPPPETAAPAPARAPAVDAPSAPAPRLTRAQIAQIERTAERGRLLIAIARAGIIATQDMLSRVSDPEGAGIIGWIAEPQGNAMEVTFYSNVGEGDAAVPKAVYRANVLGGRVVSRDVFLGDDRPPLTPLESRMAAARAATLGLEHRPCGGEFNYLVVPPATASAAVDVYQMTAPTQRGRFPLGGHFRSTVAADGTVSGSRGFTNRCFDLEAPAVPAGEQPRPIGVTHLMDPMPTEIHVFIAQMIGRPLLVVTGEPHRVWLVTGDGIAEVRP